MSVRTNASDESTAVVPTPTSPVSGPRAPPTAPEGPQLAAVQHNATRNQLVDRARLVLTGYLSKLAPHFEQTSEPDLCRQSAVLAVHSRGATWSAPTSF